MFRARWWLCALWVGLVAAPAAAQARAMSVDIWTDRGKDAIYEPDEPIEVKVRASDDSYLLVYDIDSEGSVRVLYPYAGSTGYIAGQHTYRVPPAGSGLQLVVQGPVGQGYIVAIVSREPFNALPRYLRPYDPQAESVGYVGEDNGDDDASVTADGRISGDPFVAMERIRRQVLYESEDTEAFGTAYTSYYIHEAVRYPRYLCNDCHQPGYWAWWDGWDPYYSTCSAFDFRVYWGWSWGPRYWFGTVPYFCYVPRCYPCDPYDRPYYTSWGGSRQWRDLWGGPLVRYKSSPPGNYVPPGHDNWASWTKDKPLPPGYMRSELVRGEDGRQIRMPVGANRPRSSSGQVGPRGGTPGFGGSRQGGVDQTRWLDRPRQVQIAPRGGYTNPGGSGSGRYGPSQPSDRVSAPRVTPGGGTISPRREAAPSREPAVSPPSRSERSQGESRSSPPSNDSGQRPSPSGGRGNGRDAGGGRPGGR